MSERLHVQKRPVLRIAAVFFLFFATGMSGLVYQVVWQRYLLNVFGSTIYAISTVLSAFMGGLALGSWLFGRYADRSRRLLAVYGTIEIIVGLVAVAVPAVLHLLDPVFAAAYQRFGSSFYAYSAVRFVFVFAVLLIPTTMMGGTFPLLSKFMSPEGSGIGFRAGLLYALNTTGAVVGTVLSGFYFIRWWGVSSTVYVAAAINVSAGLVAIVLSRAFAPASGAPAPAAVPPPGHSPAAVRWVLWTYAISGFAALGLEVVWSRALVFTFDLLKNTTYSFTAMLAVFLTGIALGSAVMTPFAERQKSPIRTYAAMQVLIGLSAIFSFYVLYYRCYTLGDSWFRDFDDKAGNIRWNAALALVFLRTAATMFLPTFCMGLAFPVAVRAVMTGSTCVGRDVGRLYAINTLGAIVGAASTGFLLLPALGIAKSIFVLGAVQLLAGTALYLWLREVNVTQRTVWAAIAVVALGLGFVKLPRPAIFQPISHIEQMIFYREGPFATVSVVENSLNYRTIYVDNVGVAGTEPMLLTDQKSLAHVPMLLLKNPKSALTVGFGSGGASFSYTLHPELERIDCVEITRTVVDAAPTLYDSHHDVVMEENAYRQRTGLAPKGEPLWNDGGRSGWYKSDMRYNIILDDARSYLRFTDHRYSVIATDCTDLRYKSNANLYDLEYFRLTRDRITDDGMVIVWMPLAGLSEEAMKVALRTFHRVFPDMEVFYMNNQPTHYILLLGTKGPLRVDVATVQARLARPEILRDLGEIQLAAAEKILSCFVCGREVLGKYLAGDTLNTEDFPYLEFESPRYGYGDEPLLVNLDALMQVREDPVRLLADSAGAPEFTASLARYAGAVPDIIAAHRHYRHLRMSDSCRALQNALARNPADGSVKSLLEFDELRRKVRGQPGNYWARWQLGRVLSLQGRDSEAVTELNVLADMSGPGDPAQVEDFNRYRKRALQELAALYERSAKPDRAAQYRRAAEALKVAKELGEGE